LSLPFARARRAAFAVARLRMRRGRYSCATHLIL
jgi:hypothetical protein